MNQNDSYEIFQMNQWDSSIPQQVNLRTLFHSLHSRKKPTKQIPKIISKDIQESSKKIILPKTLRQSNKTQKKYRLCTSSILTPDLNVPSNQILTLEKISKYNLLKPRVINTISTPYSKKNRNILQDIIEKRKQIQPYRRKHLPSVIQEFLRYSQNQTRQNIFKMAYRKGKI